jgi:drug/metabolite transporter (DMT)-like permease
VICTIITIVFSSNSPALHTAFKSVETPPPALLVNAAVSCIALTGIALGGPLLDTVMPTPSSLERNQGKAEDPTNLQIMAGAELGLWKGLGMTANVFGLSLTTANHAAFLIQLTTLIVPVIQSFMGYEMSKKIWLSVILALSGVFLFTQETTAAGAASNLPLGDALCLVAAIFYAGYDIRCFEWGKKVPARPLITNKIAAQAFLSLLLLAGAGLDQASEFFTSMSSTFATTFANDPSSLFLLGGVLLWSGLTVNSLAPFVQVSAQQAIGPTKAQTIYASQPMWAAFLSFFLLGETVGLQGLVGGGAFLAALFLAATSDKDPATIFEEED